MHIPLMGGNFKTIVFMFSTMRFERSNRYLFQLIKNGLLKLPLER